jgi:hypothetical protein
LPMSKAAPPFGSANAVRAPTATRNMHSKNNSRCAMALDDPLRSGSILKIIV